MVCVRAVSEATRQNSAGGEMTVGAGSLSIEPVRSKYSKELRNTGYYGRSRLVKILEQPENRRPAMMDGWYERQSLGSSAGVCNGAVEPGTAPPKRVVVRQYSVRR